MELLKELYYDEDIRDILMRLFLSFKAIMIFALSLKLITVLYQAFWLVAVIIKIIILCI